MWYSSGGLPEEEKIGSYICKRNPTLIGSWALGACGYDDGNLV